MKILYDEEKRLSNLAKHELDFQLLTIDFFETAIVYPVRTERFMAIGRYQDGSVIAVVFKPLGSEAISIISMRKASRRERTSI